MKEKQIKEKVLNAIEITIYIVFFILFYFALFINKEFDNISFEQLLYNVTNTKGANYAIVGVGARFIIISLIITFVSIIILYKLFKLLKIKIFFNIGIKEKVKKIDIFKKTKLKSILFLIFFNLILLYLSMDLLNLTDYIKNQLQASTIFEEHYVDGSKIKLEFPEKKRNLIYIFAESLENSYISKENGGFVKKSYMPNLEKLALNNINFSNSNKIGGAIRVTNTGWTMAALTAHTAGIPMNVPGDGNEYKGYSQIYPGVYNLGDILKDNGYDNYFMIGSDADFGGRKGYFEQHGDYTIYDYYYAIDNELIDSEYYVWWGYEDKKLFQFAKEKILQAAEKDTPFNFTLLTVDTHFTDGYIDSSCEEVFDTKYANAIYCSDQKIYSFVKWIMQQDFYENTTIIISGDHLTMQKDFYEKLDGYQRTIYNTIINSSIEPIKEKQRYFSALDIFPTTLAALGVKIEGDRLGMGTNLFSDKKTLLEEYGVEYVNGELSKKSYFFEKVILGDSYYEIQEKLKKVE